MTKSLEIFAQQIRNLQKEQGTILHEERIFILTSCDEDPRNLGKIQIIFARQIAGLTGESHIGFNGDPFSESSEQIDYSKGSKIAQRWANGEYE